MNTIVLERDNGRKVIAPQTSGHCLDASAFHVSLSSEITKSVDKRPSGKQQKDYLKIQNIIDDIFQIKTLARNCLEIVWG